MRRPLRPRVARPSDDIIAGELDSIDPDQGSTLGTIRPGGWMDGDMMAQRTVVVAVDDNAGLLKSLARLLA